MTLRYCNSCKVKKPETEFTKFGKECCECKKQRNKNTSNRYYSNRVKCGCGLYTSDGNPKEKHEQTQRHKDFINGVNIGYYSTWTVKERKKREATGNYFIDCPCGVFYKTGTREQHIKEEPRHVEYEKQGN